METLTDDLLEHVFLHALPSVLTLALVAPANFALVCHRWYQVVTSRSSLWASIRIDDSSLGAMNLERLEERTRTWLKLSKESPLQFYVDIELDVPPFLFHISEFLIFLLSVFESEKGRFERVCCSIKFYDLDKYRDEPEFVGHQAVFSALEGAPASLKEFVLFLGDNKSDFVVLDLSSCIQVVETETSVSSKVGKTQTKLQVLELGGCVTLRLPQPIGSLYLPHLSDLTCSVRSEDNFINLLQILPASPSLSALVLDITYVPPKTVEPDTFELPTSVISLPELAQITLYSKSPVPTIHLLASIACPMLHAFTIQVTPIKGIPAPLAPSQQVAIHIRDLLQFVSRCKPSLTNLQIWLDAPGTAPFDQEEKQALRKLLLLSKSLCALGLHGPMVDTDIVEFLTGDDSGSLSDILAPCPLLRELRLSRPHTTLSFYGPKVVRDGALDKLIIKLWKGGEGLRCIVTRVARCYVQTKGPIGDFVKAGLKIQNEDWYKTDSKPTKVHHRKKLDFE